MRRLVLACLLALVAGLVAGAPGTAQARSFVGSAVSGVALDRAGESLGTGAVQVTAYSVTVVDGTEAWRPVDTTTTEVDGTWMIDGLEPGRAYRVGFHVVSPDHAGFTDQFWSDATSLAAARDIRLEPNSEKENIDAYLRSVYPNGRYPVTAHAKLTRATVSTLDRAEVVARVTANVPVELGTMTLRDNGRVLASHTMTAEDEGRVRFSLPRLASGRHSLSIGYDAPRRFNASSSNVQTLTVKAVASTVTAKAKGTIRAKAKGRLAVTVSARGTTPTGTVSVSRKGRRLAAGTLTTSVKGRITVTLPRLAAGKHRLTVTYGGSSSVATSRRVVTVTVRR